MPTTPQGASKVSTTNGSDSDISLSELQDPTDEQALEAHLHSIGVDRQAHDTASDTSSGSSQHLVAVGHNPQATLSEHVAAQTEAFEAARNRERNPMHAPAIQRFVQEVGEAPWKHDLSRVNLPASDTQTSNIHTPGTSLEVEMSQSDKGDSTTNHSKRDSDNTNHNQEP